MGVDDFMLALLRFGILGAVSAPFVLLLKRAGTPGGWPGASIAAGILVGLLAGPTALGGAAPDWFRRSPGPDPLAAQALADQESLDGAELEALRATGVSPEALVEHELALAKRRTPLVQALDASFEGRLRAFRAGEAAAMLLLTGPTILLAAGAGAPRPQRAQARELSSGALVGAFALAFGAAANALVIALALKLDPGLALAIGAALAGGSAWFALPAAQVSIAACRPWARSWMALTFSGGMFWLSASPAGDLPWASAGLGACVLVALLWNGFGPAPPRRMRRALGVGAQAALTVVLVPALAASGSAMLELGTLFSGRPLVYTLAAVSFVGCGHLVGTVLGVAVVRPRASRAWTTWLAALHQGMPASLVLSSAVLVATGAIDPSLPAGQGLLAGALLGALSCAACAPILRRMTDLA